VKFDFVVFGLSITSSWGNGHATSYRGLVKALWARGNTVLFLERDQPWYAANRDEPTPPGALTVVYQSLEELKAKYEAAVRDARCVIVGSFVPDGIALGEWVVAVARGATAFYDIDTPLTLMKLDAGEARYISRDLIPCYDCYLSFTGGPTLRRIEIQYGAPMARALYCSVDPEHYRPCASESKWDLAYLGTYSEDRQPAVQSLLVESARCWPDGRFAIFGPGFPDTNVRPHNIDFQTHLSPREHPAFYGAQRFTLNVTRSAMKAAGFSPSVRLFEAAACGTPIISDWWEGLDSLLSIGAQVLVANDSESVLRYLHDLPEAKRIALGEAARRRILAEHTPHHRAIQLERYLREIYDYVPAHSARRNRRQWRPARRVDARLAVECKG
jgi:spore maturation protein CgeB